MTSVPTSNEPVPRPNVVIVNAALLLIVTEVTAGTVCEFRRATPPDPLAKKSTMALSKPDGTAPGVQFPDPVQSPVPTFQWRSVPSAWEVSETSETAHASAELNFFIASSLSSCRARHRAAWKQVGCA